MTDYIVTLVKKDSDHPLSKYVEDDEQLFVHKDGTNLEDFNWFAAEDFFACIGECKFSITHLGEDIE